MEKVTYLINEQGYRYYMNDPRYAKYFKEDILPWQARGLQETTTGYGHKLTTTRKVWYNRRWYRVYASCHSNCAMHYIISKGQQLVISS